MVKRLVFHIGDHKAGSSSIQNALASGQVRCADTSHLYSAKRGHNYLALALQRRDQLDKADQRFSALAATLAASDADVGLISAEEFEGVAPETFNAILTRYFPQHLDRLRLIAYVRPHAERVVSSYAEQIKTGRFQSDMDMFHQKALTRGRFQYVPRFQAWQSVFGTRLTVRPMIRAGLYRQDVVADFLRFAFDSERFEVPPGSRNETLPTQDLAILRDLQSRAALLPPNVRHSLGWAVAQGLADAGPRPHPVKPALSRALYAEIAKAYRQDAQDMDRLFFDGPVLTQALQNAAKAVVDIAQDIRPETQLALGERRITQSLAQLMVELVEIDPAAQNKVLQAARE